MSREYLDNRHTGLKEKRKPAKEKRLLDTQYRSGAAAVLPHEAHATTAGRSRTEQNRPHAVVTRVHGGGPGAPTAHTTIWIHGACVISVSASYAGKTPGTASQPPRKCPDRSASGTDHPRKPLPQPHPRGEIRKGSWTAQTCQNPFRLTPCQIYQPTK